MTGFDTRCFTAFGVLQQRSRRDHRQERHGGVVVACRDVERVDQGVEHLGEGEPVVHRQAALVGLLDAEPVDQREVGADLLAHRADDLEREPRPVLEWPAVLVGALVGLGREELLEQVSVRAVELDGVEPGGDSPARPLAVLVDQARDLVELDRPRRRPERARDVRGRGDRRLVAFGVALRVLPAGVVDLDRNLRALVVHGFGEIRQRADKAVVVDADGVSNGPPDFPVDRCVLEDDEPNAAPRPCPVVLDEPLAGLTVRGGELSEDRGLNEPVPQRHAADPALLEEGALAVGGNIGNRRAHCGHNASLWW